METIEMIPLKLLDKPIGCSFEYKGRYSDFHDSAKKLEIMSHASHILPSGTYYEIYGSIPLKYGYDKWVSWYTEPGMPEQELGDRGPMSVSPLYDAAKGRLLMGCYMTPGGKDPTSQPRQPSQPLEHPDCTNCKTPHSWYDHIGWREGSQHAGRSNCRIAGCGCESYKAIDLIEDWNTMLHDIRLIADLDDIYKRTIQVVAAVRLHGKWN